MYIQLRGQILSYEKTGSGAPLILLHGNGEDHHIYDELIPEVSKLYTVYAIDTRGHGESATPSSFHYRDMAVDISRFITALDLENVLLVGFSDGGITALLLAKMHSDMLSGMIVCGANRNPKGLTRQALHDIKKDYRKTKSALDRLMLEEPDLTDEDLGRIHVPTLLLAGEKDLVREKETAAIHAAVSDSEMKILPGEDHGSYVIHSTKLLPYIQFFHDHGSFHASSEAHGSQKEE